MKRKLVIVGAGFAGLYAAKKLKNTNYDITIIDRNNHHLFQPLLYQVATAGLNPSDIASPIRAILKNQKNVTTYMDEVLKIDRQRKIVISSSKEYAYDELIIATGMTHSYFGHDEWQTHSPGLKTIEEALEIRHRIFCAFESAEKEIDPQMREALMTFVIVGAGPTGVELAGAIAEIARKTLGKDFHNIDPKKSKVILIEGQNQVLPTYSSSSAQKAQNQLERLGVEVITGKHVTKITNQKVSLDDKTIPCFTTLWAAGVKASPLAQELRTELDQMGRVLVTEHLTLPEDENIFVLGDLAAFKQGDEWIPGVAPAAIQQGLHTAKNLKLKLQGKNLKPFRYLDKGSLATIGRAAAVAEIGKLKTSGFVAWMLWLVIHILFLIGFRNKALVMFQWAWSYITYGKSARLITKNFDHGFKC